jgi:hypothetical protein
MRTVIVSIVFVGSLFTAPRPTTAQEPSERERDPAIALGFAFLCPGCGHLYTGETTKGAVIATLSIGSLVGATALQLTRSWAPHSLDDCLPGAQQSACLDGRLDLTPILIGGAIALTGYLYGLIDAQPSARRMNARNGFGLGNIELGPAVAPDGSIAASLAIRLPTGRSQGR